MGVGQNVLNVRKFGSFDRKLTRRETGSYVSGQSKFDLGEISNGKCVYRISHFRPFYGVNYHILIHIYDHLILHTS